MNLAEAEGIPKTVWNIQRIEEHPLLTGSIVPMEAGPSTGPGPFTGPRLFHGTPRPFSDKDKFVYIGHGPNRHKVLVPPARAPSEERRRFNALQEHYDDLNLSDCHNSPSSVSSVSSLPSLTDLAIEDMIPAPPVAPEPSRDP